MKDLTLSEIALSKAVENFPKDPIYNEVPGMFIPLQDMMYLRKVTNAIMTTDTGIIIPDAVAQNSILPNTGVIMAVGPRVDEYLVPGLRVLYNPMLERNETITIKGKDYIRCRVMDVYAILPPDSYVYRGVKSHDQMRREEHLTGIENAEKHDEDVTKERLAGYDDKVHGSNAKTKRANNALKNAKKDQ